MHYTSIENIHKVIDPLFLDAYKERFHEAMQEKQTKRRIERLRDLQRDLGRGQYFDPACGSGNFLTESYLSLRRLENDILRETLMGESGTGVLGLDFAGSSEEDYVHVSIQQFHGIEINDFATSVAKTALWIAESQMFRETEDIIHKEMDFLPLHTNSNIHEGNALRMDWKQVLPPSDDVKILGNPPFVGYAYQSNEQKTDLLDATDHAGKNMDYVAGWYFKAAEYMQGTNIETAFVSTNSITQGEQVCAIWKPLYERYQIHIHFAWQTFKWSSESVSQAAVHCVIICFSSHPSEENFIYSEIGKKSAENISPYLVNSKTVFVERRAKPLGINIPMIRGSQPTDNGNFILTEDEKNDLLKKEPQAEKFIRPFMMGKDFIDRKPRYCIWLDGVEPQEIKKCPEIIRRVKAVRDFRLQSKKKATQKKADTPTLFDEIRDSKTDYIALPKVSSENRRYIPMDYLPKEIIAGDMLFMIPNAELYHFGILESNVHMAWMRTVAGRLKSDYRYSNTVVYNNFPWPTPTPEQRAEIERTAQGILDARANHPGSSLADLYDDVFMPKDLREAHRANDRATLRAYGFPVKITEPDCVAELMKRYEALTSN